MNVDALLPHLTSPLAIVTDTNVASLYGEPLQKALKAHFEQVDLFVMPAGEGAKTRETKQQLEDQLLAAGHLRSSTVVGLGGGVVTDMAGFLAATFCRGIPLVLVPTTLLAIVDAAVGGKNGVNTPHGKNLIGTFYPPKAIINDLSFLKTLPEREFRAGLAEVVKVGLLDDFSLIEQLEERIPTPTDTAALETLITKAVACKERIVGPDPTEQGQRAVLNFGHTVGHALEVLSGYQLLHGEAVALGMLVEAQLNLQLGIPVDVKRLKRLIQRLFPNLKPPPFTAEEIFAAASFDKKNRSSTPRFVTL